MVKKGKGKKGGKKAEAVEKEELTEVDKELFQIQITDLQRKVERYYHFSSTNTELSNEEYQKKYEQLDEDRADIIAYLNRVIQQKADEITELQERLIGLQKVRVKHTCIHLDKYLILQSHSEGGKAAGAPAPGVELEGKGEGGSEAEDRGKLNSLEEFRIQRDDLMSKYKLQEQHLEEQEQRHRRIIYETERKFIIGKDKLKKEMEDKLLQLSTDFQAATQVRIAATTHRAIRENIAINNELTRMLKKSEELNSENKVLRSRDNDLRIEVKLHQEEKEITLAKNMVQLKVINKLSQEYEEMVGRIGQLEYEARRCLELEQEVSNLKINLSTGQTKIAILQQQVQAARHLQVENSLEMLALREYMERLQNMISDTIAAIKQVLDIQAGGPSDEALNITRRETLLSNLLQLLNTADLPLRHRYKPSQTHSDYVPGKYSTGDLGLIPRIGSAELKLMYDDSLYKATLPEGTPLGSVGSNYSLDSIPALTPITSRDILQEDSQKSVKFLDEVDTLSSKFQEDVGSRETFVVEGSKAQYEDLLQEYEVKEDSPQESEVKGDSQQESEVKGDSQQESEVTEDTPRGSESTQQDGD
uniref:Cilia- and flagella-associated protein 157 n=1 Tax=Timema californicum TaxID=61474 RepID=A0A7R9IZY1_TIMCA|nr:unnamed protein product [Timema californicum]